MNNIRVMPQSGDVHGPNGQIIRRQSECGMRRLADAVEEMNVHHTACWDAASCFTAGMTNTRLCEKSTESRIE
jgi:hypothetical protein